MLTVGDLGCFGCHVLLDFNGGINGPCCIHDGEEVVAIDISGKIEEDDKDDSKVTHKAMSAAGGYGVVSFSLCNGGCCCSGIHGR
jgi:hypothetical protein